MAGVGLRVNEACKLDLPDVKWDLGRFGKLHVRHGKGARGSGPRKRMVPLINNAGGTLRWFAGDVWAQFGGDHTRPGAPLLPSRGTRCDGFSEVIPGAYCREEVFSEPGWGSVSVRRPSTLVSGGVRSRCQSPNRRMVWVISGLRAATSSASIAHPSARSWLTTPVRSTAVEYRQQLAISCLNLMSFPGRWGRC